MSRLVVGLIWLLHWLPLGALARVGSGFGWLLYWVVLPRRKIALTNLRLCFPELSEAERRALARRNFALIGRSMLERGLAWWAGPERLRATVRIDGIFQVHVLTDRSTRNEGDLRRGPYTINGEVWNVGADVRVGW